METQDQINMLRQEIEDLKKEIYRNNFSGYQDFSKYSNFSTRLKIPHYDSAPPVGEVGELIEIGGVLYICSSANTFTTV